MMYCLIAFFLICASLFTMIFANYYGDHTKFTQLLNKKQLEKYNHIKTERLNIFLKASFIGFILSLLTYFTFPKLTGNTGACLLASIYLITQTIIYQLYPKGPLMVTYLDKEEQRKVWSDIYYHMKTLNISGGLLGVAAYFFFAKYLCGCT